MYTIFMPWLSFDLTSEKETREIFNQERERERERETVRLLCVFVTINAYLIRQQILNAYLLP